MFCMAFCLPFFSRIFHDDSVKYKPNTRYFCTIFLFLLRSKIGQTLEGGNNQSCSVTLPVPCALKHMLCINKHMPCADYYTGQLKKRRKERERDRISNEVMLYFRILIQYGEILQNHPSGTMPDLS